MHSLIYYPILVSVYYVSLTIVLFMLSNVFEAAGFLARLLTSYVALVVSALYGAFVSILLRACGLGRISQWAAGRFFKYAMLLCTGVSFEISDPHNYLGSTRPAVFIGNHQTELDVLMLGCVFPKYCSVTAKKSLKKWPFLGWFMVLSQSVFIDRKDAQSARMTMTGAAAEVRRTRQSVFIFPEGTRSYAKEPVLLTFKKGAFNLAVDAKVPVVPIVVACYSDVMHVQSWRFRSGKILIKVLKPIPTTDLKYEDVTDLARDTRELMLKELVDLTAKQRGKPVPMPVENPVDGVIKASGSETTIS